MTPSAPWASPTTAFSIAVTFSRAVSLSLFIAAADRPCRFPISACDAANAMLTPSSRFFASAATY